jgi:uncharacterized protein YeaC (DUF1315 family)
LLNSPLLIGCDFSSRPTRRKPIVLALGRWEDGRVRLQGLQRLESLQAYADWAAQPGEWIGGFDFPFGLPRELVTALGWPTEWAACIAHYAGLDRAQIRADFKAFCAARPVGAKFAHRATDGPAGSSPSMKWVNPPVAYMLHAGVPPLLRGGVHLPGLMPEPAATRAAAGGQRVALEAYPGLLARSVLGRASYKSDDRVRQTPERLVQRQRLIAALEGARTPWRVGTALTDTQRQQLVMDASGDQLDAVLCLLQAAWAWRQGAPRYGLPTTMDPLEGWIVGA